MAQTLAHRRKSCVLGLDWNFHFGILGCPQHIPDYHAFDDFWLVLQAGRPEEEPSLSHKKSQQRNFPFAERFLRHASFPCFLRNKFLEICNGGYPAGTGRDHIRKSMSWSKLRLR